MKQPNLEPIGEQKRMAALRQYNLLDTLPEQSLDDLTSLAAHICEAPISMISLIDDKRQWFKSRIGNIGATETARDISFCGHAILQNDLFMVPDAFTDERFHDNPLVTGDPHVRFYAGAQLATPEGHNLGMLCVIDHVPRQLNQSQQDALRILSRQVMAQLELRRQTHELVESEKRFQLVTDNARVGLVIVNHERNYVYANSAYSEILGLSSPAIVGRKVSDVLAKLYEAQIRPRLDRAFAGERVTYELHRPSGAGEFHYTVRYEPTLQNGVVEFVVVVITDVTDLKNAEQALRQSAHFAQCTIDSLTAHLCVLDETGKIMATNEAWRRFVRENPPAARRAEVGDNYLAVADAVTGPEAADAKKFAAGIRAVIAGKQNDFSMEYPCHSPSEQRWFVGRVSHFPDVGTAPRVVVAHENITVRKIGEMASQQMAAIVEFSDDAIIGKDLNSIITSWNKGAEKVFGYSAKEMVGQSILRLIPNDRQDEENMILAKIRKGESVEHFETLRVKKDGRVIDVSVTASPIKDATGQIIGVSKVARDITDRKIAEKRIEVFSELGHRLSAATNAKEAARITIEEADKLLKIDSCTFNLYSREKQQIFAIQAMDESDGKRIEMAVEGDWFPVSKMIRKTVESGAHLILRDDVADPATAAEPFGDTSRRSASLMYVPIRHKKDVIGVLSIQSYTPQAYDQGDLQILQALADHCAGALRRIQTLEGLKESERRFTEMLENVGLIAMTLDKNGIITFANDYLLRLTGWKREEIIGADWFQTFIPDSDTTLKKLFFDTIDAGTIPAHHENAIKTKAGELRDIVWNNTPLRNASGQIIGTASLGEDFTERKRTLTALQESEERFREIAEQISQVFWVSSPAQNKVLYVSPAYEKVWGRNCADLYGNPLNWAEAIHVDDRPRVLQAVNSRQVTGEYDEEYRVIRPDGTMRWIRDRAFPVRNEDGSVQRIVGIADDITERKHTDERFRRLVDSNVQGVMFATNSGLITGANDAFLNIIGYGREELAAGSINWPMLTPPQYAEADRLAVADLVAKGVCAPYEKEFIRKDGKRIPVLIGVSAFQDGSDEGVCFVLDLTERKKLEAQFLRAQRMESVGTLAGGIAHDLNNVLAPILMSVDVLKDMVHDPDAEGMLNTLQTSAQRGADLIKQVLSFARGVEGERVTVNPVHILRDLVKVTKDTFPKSIDIRFTPAKNLWTVTGDPTQIHQVFLNLCVNARDAMPQGGTLTVGMENVVLDETYAAMNPESKPGSYVMIKVEDTGTGIPPEVRDRIFEPFFTTKELGKGTGLGLSTTLGIVKSHGGFIHLYSELGKGTKFKVYFPANTTQSASDQVAIEQTQLPRGHGELILVVDDEEAIRKIAKSTLERFGYHVLLACHGAEAVSLYAQQSKKIAAVLTDMAMPIMDGPALIIALKSMNPEVKIIGSSGLSANGGVAKAVGAGVKYFVPKPYTAETLLKTIHQTINEKQEA